MQCVCASRAAPGSVLLLWTFTPVHFLTLPCCPCRCGCVGSALVLGPLSPRRTRGSLSVWDPAHSCLWCLPSALAPAVLVLQPWVSVLHNVFFSLVHAVEGPALQFPALPLQLSFLGRTLLWSSFEVLHRMGIACCVSAVWSAPAPLPCHRGARRSPCLHSVGPRVQRVWGHGLGWTPLGAAGMSGSGPVGWGKVV